MASRRLSILRLLLRIRETNPAYNQFSLPLLNQQNISICTFFKSAIAVPEGITLFEGNGTFRGFFRALGAALEAGEYDIIHAHTPHVALLFLAASLFGDDKPVTRSVYTVHNSYQSYKLRNKLMLYPIVAGFRRIVCCSDSSHDSLPRLLRWLAGERISVIQNGVDLSRIDRAIAAVGKPLREEQFSIFFVGRLIEIKRPIALLHAYEQANDLASNLVFVGEGDLEAQLVEETWKLGLQRQVTLTGLIPRDEVFARLARADLFISASRGEGLPVAVLEAMACRCPVILSDIEPHREIAGGVDFIPLIEPDNIDGFAKEIRRFRSMSHSERSEVGLRCRRLAEERFGLTPMLKRYEKVYLQLVDENRRPPLPHPLTS